MLTRILLPVILLAGFSVAGPVAFTDDEDASAEFVAVSIQGNATAPVAVSGTGNATTCGPTAHCVLAVSGAGDATCSRALWCFAMSGAGDATANGRCGRIPWGQICGEAVAASGMGNASSSWVAASGGGNASGSLIAAAGDGSAECQYNPCLAVGGGNLSTCSFRAPPAYECEAISQGTGECRYDECVAVGVEGADGCSGLYNPAGCRAVSPTGPATACNDSTRAYDCSALSGTGDAESCWTAQNSYYCSAVSGTGDARSNFAVTGTGNATARPQHVAGTDILLPSVAISGTGNATACSDAGSHCFAVAPLGYAEGEYALGGCDVTACE